MTHQLIPYGTFKTVSVLIFILNELISINGETFRFSNTFGSSMVIQQLSADIWGFANLGDQITIKIIDLLGTEISTGIAITGADNIWRFPFKSPAASTDPYTITATDPLLTIIRIDNVLFGDIFICSGQSNMNQQINQIINTYDTLSEVRNNPIYQSIRLFESSSTTGTTPQIEAILWTSFPGWQIPDGTYRSSMPHFSAVCWFYGKYLFDRLYYPIGLIQLSYGGAAIRQFMSPDTFTLCPHQPFDIRSDIWNTMINPFLRTTITGIIWYQGEGDSQSASSGDYQCALPAMINDWRLKWNQYSSTPMDFPFGIVQLSTWNLMNSNSGPCSLNSWCDVHCATIRYAQTANFGFVPNAAMKNTFLATAIDLGDIGYNNWDIHPLNKQPVAERLANAALNVIYNQNTYWHGPIAQNATLIENKIQITFSNVGYNGLIINNNDGYEIQSIDGNWIYITGVIITSNVNTVIVPLPSQRNSPQQIRYNWYRVACNPIDGYYGCSIYNNDVEQINKLPAIPFILNIITLPTA